MHNSCRDLDDEQHQRILHRIMRMLLRYLKPYWKPSVIAPALMLIEVFCDLLQPHFLADIVDIGIARGDIGFVLRSGAFMTAAALIGAVGGIGCTVFATHAAQNFATDLREDLFRRIGSFSFADLDKFHTASLITRLTNDIVQLQNLVLMMLRILVRAPLMFIGGIAMAFAVNPSLALISLSTMPVIVIVLVLVIRKGFPMFNTVQKKLDRVNDVARENLTGVRVIKAFVRSAYERGRFGTANDELTSISIKAGRVVGGVMPLMMLLMNVSMIILLWSGGYRVKDGTLAVGQILALVNYVMMILFSLMMSAMMLMNASRAKVSGDRVVEVLTTEPSILDGDGGQKTRTTAAAEVSAERTSPMREGIITFEGVSFRYPASHGGDVLIDISFTARPGETLAILGATGAGKTTLVDLIPRFYDVTRGAVRIDGIDVRAMGLDDLRAPIAMILQESILFSGTVRENIRWGKSDATDAEIEKAAVAAEAHGFVSGFKDGYDTIIGQRGVNLSGGQKQRIAIARALVRDPKILIMDDSTSAVDIGTEGRIQRALRERLAHTTCIIIAQRINSVMDADRILILENGRISDTGTHAGLMKGSATYRDIYRSQIGDEAV